MKPIFERLEQRDVPSNIIQRLHPEMHKQTNLLTGWTPAGLRALYNVPPTWGGKGQTIAIVDAFEDPHVQQAINTWDHIFHLPHCQLQVINLGATQDSPGEWNSETDLDVEWAHSIAPRAKIVLVEGVDDQTTSLSVAIRYARTLPHVAAVSCSFGLPEQALDGNFFNGPLVPGRHRHNLVVVASGDDGALDGPGYPADNPNALAIGGTSAGFPMLGGFGPEGGWQFSGGGVSLLFFGRRIPDVAWMADDLFYYDPDAGGLGLAGGTSFGAPAWSAVIALMDQARHGNNITSPNQITSRPMRDITTGYSFEFSAGPGYDFVTGYGVPVVSQLVS